MRILRNTIMLMTSVCAMALASQVYAISTTLAIGNSRDLGLIDPNHPANETQSASFINILLDQALGSGPTTIGANAYTRSSNDPLAGVYPDAVVTGFADGAGNTGIATGFKYLLAKYDGPQYGSVVWYIGDLASGGTIDIPLAAVNGRYGLSHWYAFNPTGSNAPDGGSTIALTGLAFAVMGLLRRKLN